MTHHSRASLVKARAQMIKLREEGMPVKRICLLFGISRRTFYRWWNRRNEEAGLVDRPSRPHTIPRHLSYELEERIIGLRKETGYSPLKLSIVLRREGLYVSSSGIYRLLKRRGMNRHVKEREPVHRYEKKRPFELVHIDVKHLRRMGGRKSWAYQYSAVDDATRIAHARIFDKHTTKNAVLFLAEVNELFGSIERILTDNGAEFTVSAGSGTSKLPIEQRRERHAFEKACKALSIKHSRTRVRRPQTNGKVERFHGIIDAEFYRRTYFVDEADRDRCLAEYLIEYNTVRPHMGINGMTPAEKLSSLERKAAA